MFRSLLSSITSFFFVHPENAETKDDALKDKSFLRFIFRDGTGLFLMGFGLATLATFVAGLAYAEILPESMGAICTWLLIRAVGLHHGNWRRQVLEESRGQTYRVDHNEILRHGAMPHYGRIASIVFYLMTALVVGRLVSDHMPALEATHCPESDTSPSSRSTHVAHDAEPSSAGSHDARIGEPCMSGYQDSARTGTYVLMGDAIVCDPR